MDSQSYPCTSSSLESECCYTMEHIPLDEFLPSLHSGFSSHDLSDWICFNVSNNPSNKMSSFVCVHNAVSKTCGDSFLFIHDNEHATNSSCLENSELDKSNRSISILPTPHTNNVPSSESNTEIESSEGHSPVFGCSSPDSVSQRSNCTRSVSNCLESLDEQSFGNVLDNSLTCSFVQDHVSQLTVQSKPVELMEYHFPSTPVCTAPSKEEHMLSFNEKKGVETTTSFELNPPPSKFCETDVYQGKIDQESRLKTPEYGCLLNEDHTNSKRSENKKPRRLTLMKQSFVDDLWYPIEEKSGSILDCVYIKSFYNRPSVNGVKNKNADIFLGEMLVGRYVVEAYLFKTDFSKTFSCYDQLTGCKVCLKVMEDREDCFNQYSEEIRILNYLKSNGDVHKFNCVSLHDYFLYNGRLVLVFDLLAQDLHHFRKSRLKTDPGYFTVQRIQHIAFQTLTALQYIHSLHLIHCDLKPENILMEDVNSCNIKVIDFGSAQFSDDKLSSYVQSRYYRSPEVLLELCYDEKIDIWSLGCILFELWTGYPLFESANRAILLARIIYVLGPFPKKMIQQSKFCMVAVEEKIKSQWQSSQKICASPHLIDLDSMVSLFRPKSCSLAQLLCTNDVHFVSFLVSLLEIDPQNRPTASNALKHPFLHSSTYSDCFY